VSGPAPRQATAALIEAKKPKSDALSIGAVPRTSTMQSPIMVLTGHGGEVLSFQFDPSGKFCASAGHDKDIFLWEVHGECENYGLLHGHKQAVLQLAWSFDSSNIWSCSADKSVMFWDAEVCKRVKNFKGHSSFVNCMATTRKGQNMGVSGSDDGDIKLLDPRVRSAVQTLPESYQVTAVEFSADGSQVFAGGLENEIKIWDLRKEEVSLTLKGHTDTLTGLRLAPDGNLLLSNSMDNTLRIWDTRAFVEGQRCRVVMGGHMHNFEKNLLRCSWAPDGSKVAAASADKMVYIWQADTGKVVYKLPGHKGSVNAVDFHPLEPIIGSASSDKKVFLGEIDPA